MPTIIVLLLLLVASPLLAQEVGSDSATPPAQGYAPGGPSTPAPGATVRPSADLSVVAAALVLPMRTGDQIQEAMRGADTDLRRAQTRLATASQRRASLQAIAEQRRVQLREIEAKRKQADKEKRKADQSVLEAEKRTAERQMRSAERLEAVGNAERDAARQACLAAFAQHQALESELQLAQMRARHMTAAGNPSEANDGSRLVMDELERQTLEAQKKYRRQAHELARLEEDAANKRIDLYSSASP